MLKQPYETIIRGKERLFIKYKNMNTLRDTLIDFANDVLDKVKEYRCNDNQISGTTETELIVETAEEYIERIKNELNFKKYLQ